MICNNCYHPKEDKEYKACRSCREYWRLQQRKPDGALSQLDNLKKENKKLRLQIEKLEKICAFHQTT